MAIRTSRSSGSTRRLSRKQFCAFREPFSARDGPRRVDGRAGEVEELVAEHVRLPFVGKPVLQVGRFVDLGVLELPLYPRLPRVLVEHKLAAPWKADDDPVFAAGRRKAKGYRNALRALGEAVGEAKIPVAEDERLSPHSLRH